MVQVKINIIDNERRVVNPQELFNDNNSAMVIKQQLLILNLKLFGVRLHGSFFAIHLRLGIQ